MAISTMCKQVSCYQRRSTFGFYLLLVATSFVAIPLSGEKLFGHTETGDDAELRDRFVTEAPKRWQEYQIFIKSLQGSGRFDREDFIPRKGISNRRSFGYKQAADCALLMIQQESEKNTRCEVFAVNSSYTFSLGRKEPQKPWVITGVSPLTSDNISTELQALTARMNQQLSMGLMIFNDRLLLPIALNTGELQIDGARTALREGKSVVEVQFKHRPKDAANNPVRGGLIYLDPERYWVIEGYEVDAEFPNGKSHFTGKNEYKPGSKGHPIPLKRSIRSKGITKDGPGVDFELRTTLDLFEGPIPPKSDFTLPAFGLPEPIGITPLRPWYLRWYVLITGFGFGCIILGAIYYRLARRPSGVRDSDRSAQ